MIEKKVKRLEDIIKYISKLKNENRVLMFRGETKDYGKTALVPLIYRDKYIENEDIIYRETQRFNDKEFITDRTTFDKLSRIQHYSAPTRLLDISEDLMSAIYFAIAEKNENDSYDAIIYIFEMERKSIKYYDSDAISVVANLAKIPLDNKNKKSKKLLLSDIKKYKTVEEFNKQESAKFLRHEIREEKPQFEAIINPKDLTSIQCVYPKLTNNRIKSQKGLFFLFGLNLDDVTKPIQLINDGKLLDDCRMKHPIKKIHKIILNSCNIHKMQEDLKKIGITKPFIYPEIDEVSKYLKEIHK